MKMDVTKLNSLVDQHYLSRRKHPTEDLIIWTYTAKCQYEEYWTEETMMCRGLITDMEGNIKARPFRKFFNLSQHKGAIPDGEFEVTGKLDGSLGILYHVNGKPYIATKGSFISEQSVVAQRLLEKNPVKFREDVTYLFEIIFPSNRIVVDYGTEEKLVLLAIIDNETGQEFPMQDLGFETRKVYDGIKDLAKLKELEIENAEGFVIRWGNGFRLKFKFEEYLRLHRLVTQTTARSIWDLLQRGQALDEILDRVPDEFYGWVKAKKKYFEDEFTRIYGTASNFIVLKGLHGMPRREAALLTIKEKPEIRGVIFNLLDQKPVAQTIWKMLYPAHEVPFKIEDL